MFAFTQHSLLDVINWINHDVKSILKPTMTVIRLPLREALSHSNYSALGITFLHKWLFTSQVSTFCYIGQLIVVPVSSSRHVFAWVSFSRRHYMWLDDFQMIQFHTSECIAIGLLSRPDCDRKPCLLWVKRESWGLLPLSFLCTCQSYLTLHGFLYLQLKEMIHPKMKLFWKCAHSQAFKNAVCFFIRTDLEKFSITWHARQWILCSEWVPSEIWSSNGW